MREFMKSCVDNYLNLANRTESCLRKVDTPFLATPGGGDAPLESTGEDDKGTLADVACAVLMKILYGARLARWDLLRAVGILASRVTKWSAACDKALHKLVCYIHSSVEMTLAGYVGVDDTIDDFWVSLYADSDLAGERPGFKSTSGYLAAIEGPNTFFPFACKSKSLAVVCNSTPEAELAAAHLALRTVGLPAMDVFDLVCGRPVCLKLHEDNQAAIQVIKTGRNPTMRHLQRTHGISIRWLHDLFFPKDDMGNTMNSAYQLEYIESKLQRADIFTKAFRDPKEWLRVQQLIGIALRSRDSHGKPSGKVLKVATQAAGPAGGDAEGARLNALWCALEALARKYVMRGTRCRTNLVGKDAERDQYGFLKHSLPSDIITFGPIWELCKLLSPDFEFDTV